MQLSPCQLVSASSLLCSIEKAFKNVEGVGIETHAIVFTYNSCMLPVIFKQATMHIHTLRLCVFNFCLHQT